MKSRFLAYALTALFGMATLTSCGDDDGLSAEQQAYITENKAYIWEKKAEKDENGNPVYTEIVALGDTALYRVIKKEGDWNSVSVAESTVHLLDLEGHLIDGTVFQQKADSCQFGMTTLIPGFTAILYRVHPDETIEAIIPASLGYGVSPADRPSFSPSRSTRSSKGGKSKNRHHGGIAPLPMAVFLSLKQNN